jgi:hypothetical protein
MSKRSSPIARAAIIAADQPSGKPKTNVHDARPVPAQASTKPFRPIPHKK